MPAVHKIIDSSALTGILELPPSFKNKKLEVILFPVDDPDNGNLNEINLPEFSMKQIAEWSKTPEIQALVGVLKNTDLPMDININDIKNLRLTEKYGV